MFEAETTTGDIDIGKHIMDTLMDLLEHQTGIRYTYQEIKKTEGYYSTYRSCKNKEVTHLDQEYVEECIEKLRE